MATYTEGRFTVEVSDTLEQILRRAIQVARPGVLERMEEETRNALDKIVGEWPIKTGRSRAGFKIETTFGPDSVTTRIVNQVDYALFIRPKEFYGVATGYNRIVKPTMRKAATKLVKELGPRISANLQGRRV